jgi:hypothetical protein
VLVLMHSDAVKRIVEEAHPPSVYPVRLRREAEPKGNSAAISKNQLSFLCSLHSSARALVGGWDWRCGDGQPGEKTDPLLAENSTTPRQHSLCPEKEKPKPAPLRHRFFQNHFGRPRRPRATAPTPRPSALSDRRREHPATATVAAKFSRTVRLPS